MKLPRPSAFPSEAFTAESLLYLQKLIDKQYRGPVIRWPIIVPAPADESVIIEARKPEC